MFLDLMFITNDIEIAQEAESAGVDRIFIDCEYIGKLERQGHLDTHIGNHKLEDIIEIKKHIKKSKILTRINPIYKNSKDEVEKAIAYGTDIIMLPMFKNTYEVEKFIYIVNDRVKTCLLLETSQALARINDIVKIEGIDEIHIGLNDLHLSMGLTFMFELLSGGIVEYLGSIIKSKGIKWGFGGIARIGDGMLSAENIIAEHIRLGSKMVILSRTFHKKSRSIGDLNKTLDFKEEVAKIRNKELEIADWKTEQFEENCSIIKEKVRMICNRLV